MIHQRLMNCTEARMTEFRAKNSCRRFWLVSFVVWFFAYTAAKQTAKETG